MDSPHLPLAGWVEKGRQQVALTWQHTRRSGTLFLRQLNELSKDGLEGLARQWARSEEDFFVFVGMTHDQERQYQHVKDILLPETRDHYPGTFLFWLPGTYQGEMNWLREILAATLIQEEIDPEASAKDKRAYEFLRSFLDREQGRLVEYFLQRYFNGVLFWDEKHVDLSRYGYLTQEKFLFEFIQPLLERRFPRHSRIQPFMDALAPGFLHDMLMDFLSSGVLLADDHSKAGIRNVLEALLMPMGLVKRKGKQYELNVNPRQNELARHFFEQMGQDPTIAFEEIYWKFRKGEYGLLMPHFEILVLALLFSGHLVAYKGLNRKGPEELARTGLKGITALGKGEILGEDMCAAVSANPLIPRRFKKVPITLALQEELWAEIKSLKPSALEDLEALKSRIQWMARFEAFKKVRWNDVLRDMEEVTAQWDEVKVSLPSREGLGRFIGSAQREPFLDRKLKAIEEARNLLEHADKALFVHQYLDRSKARHS